MKHRRILLLFTVFVALLLGLTWLIVTNSGASRSVIEAALSRIVNGLSLEDASVDPTTGRFSLRSVRIQDPRRKEGHLLTARRIDVDVGANPLDKVGAIQRVRIEDLDLDIDLTAGETLDLRKILRLESLFPDDPLAAPAQLPAIELVNARLSVRLVVGADPIVFEEMDLELLPEDAAGRRVVLRGNVRSPNGYTARITGSGDLANSELRAVFEARDVPMTPALVHAISPPAETWLANAGFRGIADKLTLWIEHAKGTDSGFTAGVGLEFREMALSMPEVPYPLASLSGRVSATTRQQGTVTFEVHSDGPEGRIVGRGSLSSLWTADPVILVQVDCKQVPVNDMLAKAVRSQPSAAQFYDAFEPGGGTASAVLEFKTAGGEDRLQFSMDLDLHGVSGTFLGIPDDAGIRRSGFPLRVDDLRGQIQIRPDGRVVLHSLQGTRSDGGTVTVRGAWGRIQEDLPRNFELEVIGRDLMFSSALRSALSVLLPDEGAETYDSYAPSGHLDVDVRIEGRGSDTKPEFQVQLRPRAASARFSGFPIGVTDIHGTVEILPAGVTIDLNGSRGNSKVRLGGRFLHAPSAARLRSELWIQAAELTIDEEVRTALQHLDPTLEEVWTHLSPGGVTGVEATLWRAAEIPAFAYDIRLDLAGASATVSDFRVPMRDLRGQVFVHGAGADSTIEISAVRGLMDNDKGQPPAALMIQGSVVAGKDALPGENAVRFDVTTVVRNLQLTRPLAIELDAQGMIDLPIWEVLAPSGFVDLVARQTDGGSEVPTSALRIRMRDVGSRAAVLPGPASGMRGELLIQDRDVRFGELRGRVGSAEVAVHEGSVHHGSEGTTFQFIASAETFPLDANLANLMNGPLRRAYLERNVRGSMRVPRLQIRIDFPADGSEFTTTFSGQFAGRDVALNLVAPVERVHGIVEIQEATMGPAGGFVRGSASRLSFHVVGHEVNDFSATFAADPEQVTFSDAEMRMHGGRVWGPRRTGEQPPAPTLRFAYAGAGNLQCDVTWQALDLSLFLRAAGNTSSRMQGALNGSLNISRLLGSDLVDMEAEARIQVENGFLGEVPIFSAIFATLEPSRRPRFDGLDLDLKITNQEARIERLLISSPLLEVTGEGKISLDGYVDMVLAFPNLFGTASEVLVLPRLLTLLTSQVVRFHVFGYLRDLKTRSRLMWQQDPGRRRIRPLPAPTEELTLRRF